MSPERLRRHRILSRIHEIRSEELPHAMMEVMTMKYSTFTYVHFNECTTLTPSHKYHEGVSNQDRMSS